ncbi:MAG: hypothetical protein CVT94_17705 [Bacteroidetes bacterium HGW-Bacteroidetes-11]|jgi:hypothetical protein|nr:MAG: hypothetical protein CVT94_17705 [Bacteroidetes bacterium HGW-Bacteroidetes-11]
MKRSLYALSATGAAIILLSLQSFAQWSAPEVLFPWQAVPAQFGDEDVSPFLASVNDASGTIHLVWSNENQGQTALVYAKRENGNWSNMNTITDENPYSVLPSLVIDADQTLHCAWVDMDFNFNFIISYSRKFTGQDWEAPVVVSDPEFMLNTYPQLIIDQIGNVRLFYTAADFSGNNTFYFLKHSIIDQSNTGTPIQQPVPQTSPDNLANHSIVVSDGQGILHCSWHDSEGGVSNISAAEFDGSEWGMTTKLAIDGQGTTLQDDMPIVLATNSSNEIYSFWAASMVGHAQYSVLNNSTWTPKQNIDDSHFRNAVGLFDGSDVLHMAGTGLTMDGGDLYHHTLQNENWEHTLIEAGTSTSKPGFPTMIISNDTLFCYYVRITQAAGYQLVESYLPLDFQTGIEQSDPMYRSMLAVYPNPANTSSMVNFNTPSPGPVVFKLHNLSGKTVKSNTIQIEQSGIQTFAWNQIFGNTLPINGLYVIEVISNGFQHSGKVIIAN